MSSCRRYVTDSSRTSRPLGRPHSGRSVGNAGFTLIEMCISMLVLTIGLVGIAAMLAVTTQMQIGAREGARSTRLAQDKFDELMKLDFGSDPAVAVGGNLNADAAGYSESPMTGVTLRWAVAAGPTADTRVVTVRVLNQRSEQYRQIDLSTMIREW